MNFSLSLAYILMPVSIALSFLWAPPAAVLGETSRIIYFHVPSAWVAVLAFAVAGIFSVINLLRPGKFFIIDEKAKNSAVIGILFTLMALITGSIWAKLAWGSFWNWDPRQTSIVILLLIYIAYLSLWSALEDNPSRGKITSAYLIISFFLVPLFVFAIPRMYPSLHPDPIINSQRQVNLDPDIRLALFFSAVSFTILYFYLFSLANRISILKFRIEEKKYDSA